MRASAFIRALNFICPINSKTAKKWVAWSKEAEDIEYDALCCTTYRIESAGEFRERYLAELSNIIGKYGMEVASQVIGLGNIPNCPYPYPADMMGIASAFAWDRSTPEILDRIRNSCFDSVAESCRNRQPIKSNGLYSPQNYLYAVTGLCYFFSPDKPIRKQIEQILIHHRLPHVSFALSETQDALRPGVPMVLVDCSDSVDDDDTGEERFVEDLRWFRVPDGFREEDI